MKWAAAGCRGVPHPDPHPGQVSPPHLLVRSEGLKSGAEPGAALPVPRWRFVEVIVSDCSTFTQFLSIPYRFIYRIQESGSKFEPWHQIFLNVTTYSWLYLSQKSNISISGVDVNVVWLVCAFVAICLAALLEWTNYKLVREFYLKKSWRDLLSSVNLFK